MAVLIASDIAKDMAGEPLLRGVSFQLRRREQAQGKSQATHAAHIIGHRCVARCTFSP